MGREIEVTQTDIDIARSAVKFMLERSKGDINKFAENVVQVIASKHAIERHVQNALHAQMGMNKEDNP